MKDKFVAFCPERENFREHVNDCAKRMTSRYDRHERGHNRRYVRFTENKTEASLQLARKHK